LNRHLSGSQGFTSNDQAAASPQLRRLSDVVGAGRSWLEPLFIAPVDAIERNVEIGCLALAREIERDGGSGEELGTDTPRIEAIPNLGKSIAGARYRECLQ